MANILKVIVEKPTEKRLIDLGVKSWPIWTKEVSTFDWQYDEQEICLFLDGDVTVKTPFETVSFGKSDLVTFPKGLSCTWHVKKAVRKHYKFGDA
ncbi:MAG: cupin domain-containing protein [Candidatus Omnitrophota bacterium]